MGSWGCWYLACGVKLTRNHFFQAKKTQSHVKNASQLPLQAFEKKEALRHHRNRRNPHTQRAENKAQGGAEAGAGAVEEAGTEAGTGACTQAGTKAGTEAGAMRRRGGQVRR
jgi:hypothetical protein